MKLNPEIREIVKEWLEAHNYDGLFDNNGCACSLEDLIPCDQPSTHCEAGYKAPCTGVDCEGNCDFHIVRDRGLIEVCINCGILLTSENQVTIEDFKNTCYFCYSGAKPRTVCIDFDGVMAKYDGWKGEENCGEPMPGLPIFLMHLKRDNWQIVIHTTRKRIVVDRWLEKHGLLNYIKLITNEKLPAIAYIDDRAICFLGNFAAIYEQLKNFKPHWKK